MKDLGKTIDVHIYPDAGHAFENPNNKDGYRPDDAQDAWKRAVAVPRVPLEEVANSGKNPSAGKIFFENRSALKSTCKDEFLLARPCYSGYYAAILRSQPEAFSMNIGETIRNFRLQKGMSQGDIEKRTGLLRCYLSRVENGHTVPSLDTLTKIAGAMELPLSQFFSESGHTNGSKGLPQLSEEEVRFLSQIRRYAVSLNDSDRKLVLAMVKKMASNTSR